ncbi:MAG: hypothetical protein AB1305_04225 [Candidatus Hadarchaeota archaeon]
MRRGRIVLLAGIVLASLVAVIFYLFMPSYQTPEHPIPGLISAKVFDGDLGPSENYRNENVIIMFMSGRGVFRYVGHPTQGLTVDVSNVTRGWGPFVADVKGQENYARGYVEENGYWVVGDDAYIFWKLYLPNVTVAGRLEESTAAYLYLWGDKDDNATNGYGTLYVPTSLLWNEGDNLELTVQTYWDGKLAGGHVNVTLYGEN